MSRDWARRTSRRAAHDVHVFERDGRAGGHANTVVHDGLALDTGFLVHNERNYPLLGRLFGELGVATHESEMSFSVSCSGCGLEYSGRRPFAQPANAARPGFLALLWEIGRWLRTARAGGRGAVARRVPRRARLLAALPPPLPRALDLGALVDGAGPRARVPGRVRDPLLRQPRHARLRPLPLAHRHGRQPPLRATRSPRVSAVGSGSGAASARYGATADGVELRVGDGRRALRPGRGRDARRPGARAARGREPRRAARARRLRVHEQRGDPAHRLALPAAEPARPRLLELPPRRRRPPDDHLPPEPAAGARRPTATTA